MKKYKLTLYGGAILIILQLILFPFDIEFFDSLVIILENIEHYEVDEFVITFLFIFIFYLIDKVRINRLNQIEMEKLKIYRSMLKSTHHILNNFLNQMMIFKMEAENTSEFDPNILALYDKIINDAKIQIEALGKIDKISAKNIENSIFPK